MNKLRLISPQFSTLRAFSTSPSRQASLGACGMKPDYGPLEIGRCTLRNGIQLVSARPFGAPMAACTILYQSGSRFEYDDQLGATHFLRTCSNTAGCSYTTFSKTRVLQQLGSYITVNSDRQSVAFTLRCPVPAFHDVKYYLLDIAARTCFRQHEIDAYKPQLKRDLQNIHPEVLVMDLIQKACWGGGLNNSVFCEKERIDSMSSTELDVFSALHMRSDTCAVGSYGLPHDEVMAFAEMIEYKRELPVSPRCYPPSFARGGFEYHDLGPDSDTWIAVAVPGCGNTDLPCLMSHNIIASACGTGNNSRGQHDEDRVPQPPLGGYATDVSTMFRAFNISYADSGVFGILVKTRSCNACSAALIAASFLKKLGELTAYQICIGKQRLKLDIALQEEDCVSISEGMALQAACCARLDNAYETIKLLNTVTDQEVFATAKCLASKCNKMAVAVVGDVQAVSHDRELLCAC
ncbi:cytochrome b-c1 complex subunit 2, mitochondrial-like [Cydia strobilella]|uniref:cytochrome b-c1 complex subunit 2, mitochondrial-like n=1 Tax=Cydia strobilella TaxID=1100964 RepID=UPI00300443DF